MRIPRIVEEVWKKYSVPEDVRRHCIAVARTALKIVEVAKRRGYNVDVDAVFLGSLLHDIGRVVTNKIEHFVHSAEILRREGFDEKIVKIVERHFSAGIKAEEAEKLGIEKKDYIPETLEEKIVSFADNITFGETRVSFDEFIKYLEEIGKADPAMSWLAEISKRRAIEQKEEIERITGLKF